MKKIILTIAVTALALVAKAQSYVPFEVPGYYFKQTVPSVFRLAEPEVEYNRIRYDFYNLGERKMMSYVYNMDYLVGRKNKYVSRLRTSLLRQRGVAEACEDLFNEMKEFGERRCKVSDIEFMRTHSSSMNIALIHIRSLIGHFGYAAIFFSDDAQLVFYVKDLPNGNIYVSDDHLVQHLLSIDTYDPRDPYAMVNNHYFYYNPRIVEVAPPPPAHVAHPAPHHDPKPMRHEPVKKPQPAPVHHVGPHKPAPHYDAQPRPQPKPEPATRFEPKPQPKPEPKPQSQPIPQFQPRTDVQQKPVEQPRPEVMPNPSTRPDPQKSTHEVSQPRNSSQPRAAAQSGSRQAASSSRSRQASTDANTSTDKSSTTETQEQAPRTR